MSSMTKTFEPGEVIALKSGGPALTVLAHEGDMVKAIFFSDEIGEFRETSLPVIAVEHAELDEEEEDEDDAEGSEDEDEEDEDEEDEDQPGSGKR
jgi:uncharacterized protein YodC (DUF2158 family)